MRLRCLAGFVRGERGEIHLQFVIKKCIFCYRQRPLKVSFVAYCVRPLFALQIAENGVSDVRQRGPTVDYFLPFFIPFSITQVGSMLQSSCALSEQYICRSKRHRASRALPGSDSSSTPNTARCADVLRLGAVPLTPTILNPYAGFSGRYCH